MKFKLNNNSRGLVFSVSTDSMGKKSRKALAVAQTSNLQHDDDVKEQGKHFLRLSTRTSRLTITPDVPLAVADAVKKEDEPRVP